MTSYARLSFTNEDEKLLIEFVQEHRCLWDSNCEQYSNANARKECWKIIAQKLNKTEIDCVRKWRFIRDYYLHKRKHKSKIYSKPNSKYQTVTFLNNIVPRQKRTPKRDYQTEFVTFKLNHANDEVETTLPIESLVDGPEELYESDLEATVEIVDNDNDYDTDNDDKNKVEVIPSDNLLKEEQDQEHIEMIDGLVAEEFQKEESLMENEYMPNVNFLIEEAAVAAELDAIAMAASHFDCVGMDAETTTSSEILPTQSGEEATTSSSLTSSSSSQDKVIDLFFQSMAATVKTFPANLVARAKLKVFNAISELELELHPAGE